MGDKTHPIRLRGRPTDADSEQTRQRCIDVAIRMFAASGYAGVGTRAIAEAAGITAPGLYNYFPSKAALYGAAWAASLNDVYAQYETAVAGRPTLAAEMHAIIDRSAALIAETPWIPQLGLTAAHDASHPELAGHLDLPDSVTNFFEALARRAVHRGEFRPPEATRVQTFLVIQLWGISAISSYNPLALQTAIDAAKWSIDAHFPPNPPTT